LLYDFIGNARATIYIPIDEDFGMSPVESMSAWKPVSGVNGGGLKETIIHLKTWYLIDPECKVEDIISAVRYLSPEESTSMQWACEERAKEFGLESFKKQLRGHVK